MARDCFVRSPNHNKRCYSITLISISERSRIKKKLATKTIFRRTRTHIRTDGETYFVGTWDLHQNNEPQNYSDSHWMEIHMWIKHWILTLNCYLSFFFSCFTNDFPFCYCCFCWPTGAKKVSRTIQMA